MSYDIQARKPMSTMSKVRMSLYVAVLVSMLFHLIVFNFAFNTTWVRKMLAEAPGKEFFKVEDVMTPATNTVLPETNISIEDVISFSRNEKADFEDNKEEEDVEKLLDEQEFIPFDASEEEIYNSIKNLFDDENLQNPVNPPDIEGPGKSVAQEILAIEGNMLSEDIESSGWYVDAGVPRGHAVSDFIYVEDAVPESTGAGGGDGAGETPIGVTASAEDKFDIAVKNVPTIIKPPSHETITRIETSEIEDTLAEDISEIRKFSSLDDLLSVSLYTYHEPGDPKGFFEIIIKPRADKAQFEIIPKDIVFIVDSSSSIVQSKLDEYVEGLKHAISNLNEDDRFNIVEFKDYVNTMDKGLIQATALNKSRGWTFLRNLKSTGETDVYKAFQPLVKERPSPDRPYILFLVTDGRPTSGVVENREIINNLTRTNQDKASVYAFAGGTRINEYLLDLLSYRNKGASKFEKKLRNIRQVLADFYEEIKNPILLDLEYNFASLDTEEIYPKVLPDFFLGSRIVILGRYEGEGVFSMQLLGKVNGETKEYIFQQQLTERDNGSRDVARLWAFRKIYDLIGTMVEKGESKAILSEIKNLADEFDIKTPYY